MSKLKEELKKLQSQQLKADFFAKIRENIKAIKFNKNDDAPEKTQVIEEITAFVDAQIDMIESGEVTRKEEINEVLTSDEVKVLKSVAAKVMKQKPVNTGVFNEETPAQPAITKEQRLAQMTANDPIKFALKHRHLDGKVVVFNTPNGDAQGKVVGLNAPNVVVELNDGKKINVPVNGIREA
jgi:uncharacterized protein YlzI (FlbEa/FlbD family)